MPSGGQNWNQCGDTYFWSHSTELYILTIFAFKLESLLKLVSLYPGSALATLKSHILSLIGVTLGGPLTVLHISSNT